jgi:hypothetical protein
VRAAHRPEERRVDVPVADALTRGGEDGGGLAKEPLKTWAAYHPVRQTAERVAASSSIDRPRSERAASE